MHIISAAIPPAPKSAADIAIGQNFQIPNKQLNSAFGELNITPRADRLDIVATVLMEPVKEGAQTGIAFDGSASMQSAFGRAWAHTTDVDQLFVEELKKSGKAKAFVQDGQSLLEYTSAGWQELIKAGYVVQTENIVEPIARDVIPYLAEKLDADGGTTVLYWACSQAGDRIEEAGDFTAIQARAASYAGPTEWGEHTHLLPAVRYFVDRFANAQWGFYVFITDGKIDDLQAVKDFTADLARKITSGRANPVKFVLIGVGLDIDESQMQQLDDLPDALDLPIDLWDHKIAAEMRDLRDIFAEVVDENVIVAPTGRILDDAGNLTASFSDGVPSLLRFSLPFSCKAFTLQVGNHSVFQPLFPDL